MTSHFEKDVSLKYTRINSKLIRVLNIKSKTLQILEVGSEFFCNLGIRKGFVTDSKQDSGKE